MAELWLPGAHRLTPAKAGGTPLGTAAPRAIWHTTESPGGDKYFWAMAAFLRSRGTESHILWDPDTGKTGQFFPANRSARAVGNSGLLRNNRVGRVTVQVEILGYAHKAPLKNSPCVGLDRILEWMDDLGICREWPAGLPLAPGEKHKRSTRIWLTKGGHYAHSQIPSNTHGDPGLVDPDKFKPVPIARVISLADVRAAAVTDPKGPQGRTIHKQDVLVVERALVAEGLLDKRYIDGSFGTKTTEAYRAWQRQMGYLGADADGIPGRASLLLLGHKQGFTVI